MFCHLRNGASVCDLLNDLSFRCWRLAYEVPYWSNESFGLAFLWVSQSAPNETIRFGFWSCLSQQEVLNVWLSDLSTIKASDQLIKLHIRRLPKGIIIFWMRSNHLLHSALLCFYLWSLIHPAILVQVNPFLFFYPVKRKGIFAPQRYAQIKWAILMAWNERCEICTIAELKREHHYPEAAALWCIVGVLSAWPWADSYSL